MDILITVVVVLGMIAVTAYVIHLLNGRHRHQHLRAVHYDHGLAGFGGVRAGRGAGVGRAVPPAQTVQEGEPAPGAAENRGE
ncbi:hypothetical protein ACFVXE_12950 [Streptomyces sp. NPDC058231]|uniref:hypothetical protein n=1 Tax=unclassified Streptomyces TaxID=2593676 RepID=UPI0036E68E05